MERDPVGAAQLGQRGGPNGVGLVGFAGLANGGHVIDVDAENCQIGFPYEIEPCTRVARMCSLASSF